ncbi:hypothetical protein Pint_12883 [Pistacia integerrima]|uniref:Uncharacterized protein n=1 Tax=Pistacia integerrima TaxID=434235 RepID=A0ACC0Y658_9ROSI|nr:hypothetical protein Pint_12883 [Pistacia integerrima]
MGKIVQQIEEEISCESSMDISKVADREIDDDGRSKRTGIHPLSAQQNTSLAFMTFNYYQSTYGQAFPCIVKGGRIYVRRAPHSGKRNYSYGEAVKCYLGGNKYEVCELVQFILLTGMLVGYTITTSISME